MACGCNSSLPISATKHHGSHKKATPALPRQVARVALARGGVASLAAVLSPELIAIQMRHDYQRLKPGGLIEGVVSHVPYKSYRFNPNPSHKSKPPDKSQLPSNWWFGLVSWMSHDHQQGVTNRLRCRLDSPQSVSPWFAQERNFNPWGSPKIPWHSGACQHRLLISPLVPHGCNLQGLYDGHHGDVSLAFLPIQFPFTKGTRLGRNHAGEV